MIKFLADHNMEGQAELLWGTMNTEGWLELYPLQLIMFAEVGLPKNSNDAGIFAEQRNAGPNAERPARYALHS
jgi:hypothetical protein